jgi:heme exporter protein D
VNGIVQGGWPFVWAAYIVTALVLGGYAVHAIIAGRIARRLARHDGP